MTHGLAGHEAEVDQETLTPPALPEGDTLSNELIAEQSLH